jgi:hypothetical protein
VPPPNATDVLLVAATALHAGFQLVVTGLVYPAFAEVPEEEWAAHHGRHTRRITWLVVPVYGAAVAAGCAVLLAGPSGWQLVSVGATALAVLTTALVAGPAHGRLAAGRDPAVLRRLLRADRVRCAAALVAAVGATLALV